MQCSQFVFICMYVCMYIDIHIRYTFIVRAQSLWSRPPHGTGPTRRQSKDCARARAKMEQGPYGTGLTRRRSVVDWTLSY